VSRPRLPPHHHLLSRRIRRGCVSPCWPLPTHRPRLPPRVRSGPPSSQAPRLAPLPTPWAASMPRLAPIPAPRVALSTTPAPRVAPSTMPAPRVALSPTPAPREAPPTPPAPCAASSTPTTRFADPTHVYHRRHHVTTSAPADPGPSTSPVRFADPAVVYHHRESATPAVPDVPADHPVAIHRDPGHVHTDGDPTRRRRSSTCRPADLGS
jgi:hypothetical protein